MTRDAATASFNKEPPEPGGKGSTADFREQIPGQKISQQAGTALVPLPLN